MHCKQKKRRGRTMEGKFVTPPHPSPRPHHPHHPPPPPSPLPTIPAAHHPIYHTNQRSAGPRAGRVDIRTRMDRQVGEGRRGEEEERGALGRRCRSGIDNGQTVPLLFRQRGAAMALRAACWQDNKLITHRLARKPRQSDML